MIETKWNLKDVPMLQAYELSNALHVPLPVAAIFVGRGYDSIEAVNNFCAIGWDQLHNPWELPDIEPVVERLAKAIEKQELISVYGDYDVDGITSTCVIKTALELLGANFIYRVPHRVNDGYDVRRHIVDEAIEAGATLLMTVDCGIVAFDAASYAREKGVDLIVTDHHMPSLDGRLPHAVGVINPNRLDSTYPFSGLAGVGIAFKTMSALIMHMGASVEDFFESAIEYVALGTVADVAPMIDENRTLVRLGCERLTHSKKPGVQALLKLAGVNTVDTTSIGFFLGPRINAIGRLSDAGIALELLLEQSESRAKYLANILENANKRRQQLQEQTVEEATALLGEITADRRFIVVRAKGWEKGLVGLVAGKIAEKTGRPTLCATILDNGMAVGSGRSTRHFDILGALKSEGVWDLFAKREDGSVICGGHEFACGFTVPAENLELLEERLNAYANKVNSENDVVKYLDIDAVIQPSYINSGTLQHIQQLAPFGSKNPEPVFLAKSLEVVDTSTVGAEGKHLKLKLRASGDENAIPFGAICWRRGNESTVFVPGSHVDLVFKMSMEEFRGRTNLSLTVEDIRAADPPEKSTKSVGRRQLAR